MESRERKEDEVKGLLLDTHYWIWLQMGNASLIGPSGRREILAAQMNGTLFLSATSVLEAARLAAAGNIDFGMSIDQFVEETEKKGGLKILPLTNRILIESTRLPGTLHRDPSDRLIVATARENGLILITQDGEILAYARQGHVNARKV